MNEQRPVLIMAGGTGGHVFPALAVAECLRQSIALPEALLFRSYASAWLDVPGAMAVLRGI